MRQFSNEEDIILLGEKTKFPKPHKHDILSCLTFGGKWVTSQMDLQVNMGLGTGLHRIICKLIEEMLNFTKHISYLLTFSQMFKKILSLIYRKHIHFAVV